VADKREFLVVIDGRETVSPAAGKASDSLGKLGDKAKDTEQDFTGLDRKMREHADTIKVLREEIAKTGDTKLFGELGRQERELGKLTKLRDSLTKEGGDSATGFFAAFSGKLGPLMARLPISAPLAAVIGVAAAAAAPALGATIAGAVIGAAGVGGIVGGVVLASKNPQVKSAATALATDIGTRLERAAEPFVPAILDVLNQASGGVDEFEARLRTVFARSSQWVKPLADSLGRGGSAAFAGFERAVESAGPVVAVLGDRIEDLGETAGGLFSMFADDGPAAADALNQALGLLNATLKSSVFVINGLTESYDFLRENQGIVGDWLNPYINKQELAAKAQEEAARAAEAEAAALAKQGSAAYTAAQMTDLLTTALDRQVDGALSAAEASLRHREALARAAETADKKRGANLEEERALYDLARATNDATRALDDSNLTAEQVKDRYNEATAAFVNTAIKMGYTEKAARELSDELLKIPKRLATEVLINSGPAVTSAKNIQKAINNIHGKTVYVNVYRSGEYGSGDQGAMHGPSRNAAGGPVKAGEISWVGEQGKELLVMPRDGYVLNNRDSAMLAAGGGGGTPFTGPSTGTSRPVVLQIAPGRFSGFERMFLSWLKEAVANAGGNPAALGY